MRRASYAGRHGILAGMRSQNLVLALLAVLVAAACGDAEPAQEQPPTTAAYTTTTVIVTTTASPPPAEPTTVATVSEPTTTTTAAAVTTTLPPTTSTTTLPVPLETAGSEGVGDSFYPLLGNGGYDALHYDIELDVDPAANMIEATTTIMAAATQDLSAFNLDLSGLQVESVGVDGEPADFSREGTEMTVIPPAMIPEGAQFSVAVTYSGTPEPVNDPAVPFTALGWHSTDGVIFTINEPSGAMSWFPGNNHPTDKATFEFRITVPSGTTAAANGLLVDEVTDAGRTTVAWRTDDPMATYLAAVYIGDFERRVSVQPDGLLIRDYLPPDVDPSVVEALSITPDTIRYFETIFGPYPFDVYGTLVAPFETGYAIENHTLSLHGLDALHPATIAHEVVHHWIGNSLSLSDWSDIWLLEGFATYLSVLFLADEFEFDLEDWITRVHEHLIKADTSPPKGIERHEMFEFAPTYGRGALTLHALRAEVGDPIFGDILRVFYENSAGSNTNTEEWLDLVTELGGDEAADLTRSWLYDTDVPGASWAVAED